MSGPWIGHSVLLWSHIAAGVAALAVGPLAVLGERRGWSTRLGVAYQVSVAALAVTALGLVALAPARLWWLIPIAVATVAAAAGGAWLRRRDAGGWTPWQVRLLGGSYVSLVTALFVVQWGTAVAWLGPGLTGFVVVETAAHLVDRRTGPPRT
ncbi:MAG TPA: hypothetical protein VGR21_13175, partial [Cryptosporangiaceae bacterium]|nr:hypothetical protein [Cryptosporangiaceae bacterium]